MLHTTRPNFSNLKIQDESNDNHHRILVQGRNLDLDQAPHFTEKEKNGSKVMFTVRGGVQLEGSQFFADS